jgi:amino acid transporter/ubiquinone/menaquinone biosynthesis C-methylase UbiE
MKETKLPIFLTKFDWKLLYTGTFVSTCILMLPFLLSSIKSYGIMLILLFIVILYVIFQDVFSEFQSTFIKSSGSIFEYFKQSMNKGASFIFSSIGFLCGLIFSYHYFFQALGSLIQSDIFRIIIIFAMIIFLYTLSLFSKRSPFFILHGLSFISIIFIILMIAMNISAFELTLPFQILDVKQPVYLFMYMFVLYFLINTPISVFTSETEEFEEDIQDIAKMHKMQIAIVIPIILFIFSGILNVKNPVMFRFSFEGIFGSVGSILYLLSMGYVFIIWTLALPRFIFQLIQDGLLPSYMHKKPFFMHIVSVLALGGLLTIIYLCTFLEELIATVLILSYLLVVLLVIGAIIMRKKRPELERPVSIKHLKLLMFFAILSAVVGTFALIIDPLHILSYAIIFILSLFLFIFYLLFELYYNEEMVGIVRGITAWIAVFFHRFILPKSISSYLLDLLGDGKEKSILEYGSGEGSFTMKLAEHIGSKGKLYTTDISKNTIIFVKKRLEKKNYHVFKIKVVKSKPSSLNPAIPNVDKIISVGSISHVKHVGHLIKEMNLLLPTGGKIVIMDYNKLFGFFPNKWLNSDDKIKKYFDHAGFGVSVERKRSIFWEYVIISGIKFKNAYYMDTWYTKE